MTEQEEFEFRLRYEQESGQIERRKQPRIAQGIGEAWEAGYQRSLPGLVDRKAMPELEVTRQDSKWYEELAATVAQMFHETPESILGATIGAPMGGAAGAASPVPGGAFFGSLIGGGVGAMALPTALRESYIQSLQKGQVRDLPDFLERAKLVGKATLPDAALGSLAALGGPLAMRTAGQVIAPAVGTAITAKTAGRAIGAAGVAAEVGVFGAVAPLMHGQAPELRDLLNAGVMVGGFRVATSAGGRASESIKAQYADALNKAPEVGKRVGQVYAKTGAKPEEVVAAAKHDPQIVDDLVGIPKTTKQINEWNVEAQKPLDFDGVATSNDLATRLRDTLGEDHFASIMLDKMGERFKGYKVEVLSEQEWVSRGYSERRVAQTSPKDNALQFKGKITRESALHEITHEATQLELQVNPTFKTEVRGIMDRVQAEITAGRVSEVNARQLRRTKRALESEAEFVAYGLTNPEVIDTLRGIRGEGSNPTLFTKFVAAVAQAFGFKDREYTALHDLIRAVERGVDESRPYEGGTAKDYLRGTKAENMAADAAKAAEVAKGKADKAALRAQAKQQAAEAKAADKAASEQAKRKAVDEAKAAAEEAKLAAEQAKAALAEVKALQAKPAEVAPAKSADLPIFQREIPRAYEKQATEVVVRDAVADAKAEMILENPTGNPDTAKVPFEVNLSKYEGPQELRAIMARVNEMYLQDKKPQSHAQTEAMADAQLAQYTTPQDLAKMIKARREGNAASSAVDARMQEHLLKIQASEAFKMVQEYKTAVADGTVTPKLKVDALDAINRLVEIQTEMAGGLTESARALEYAKRTKELRTDLSKISDLTEMYGQNPDALLNSLALLDNPQALSKAVAKVKEQSFSDKAVAMYAEFVRSALLGPISTVTNTLGSMLNMGWAPMRDLVASAGGIVHPAESLARPIGNLYGAYSAFVQAAAFAKAQGLGVTDIATTPKTLAGAKEITGKVIDTLWVLDKETLQTQQRTESRQSIPGATGLAIRTAGFTPMKVSDMLMQTMIQQGEIATQALRRTSEEGYEVGSPEFGKRMAEHLENPDPAWVAKAEEVSLRESYQGTLGPLGKLVMQGFNSSAIPAPFRVLIVQNLPFIGTPIRVFQAAVEKSPFARMSEQWRNDVKAGGAVAHKAIADMVLGTTLASVAAVLAYDGVGKWITGALDPDPDKRNVQRAAGMQEYSIKINGEWKSYKWAQPFSTLLGAIVDMVSVHKLMTKDEQARAAHAAAIGFSNAVTSQTALQGAANILKMLGSEADRNVDRWMQSTAAMHVPAWISQVNAKNDPYLREINSVMDAVKNRTWLREKLEIAYDPFGQPLPNPERFGFGGYSPIKVTKESESKVVQEAVRLGIGMSRTPKTVQLPGIPGALKSPGNIGKVELTPEQRTEQALVSGTFVMDTMSRLVASPRWDKSSEGQQRMIFAKVIKDGEERGNYKALSPEQRMEEREKALTKLRILLQKPDSELQYTGPAEPATPATERRIKAQP